LRIVGQLEPADQMRPQALSAPDLLHRTDANFNGLRLAAPVERLAVGGGPASARTRRPLLGSAAERARAASCRAKAPTRLPRRTLLPAPNSPP
jgi:hypothetical protein